MQLKPITFGGGAPQFPEIFKEKAIQTETHKAYSEKFGGQVFYAYSAKAGEKKEICNPEVIGEIEAELKRLS